MNNETQELRKAPVEPEVTQSRPDTETFSEAKSGSYDRHPTPLVNIRPDEDGMDMKESMPAEEVQHMEQATLSSEVRGISINPLNSGYMVKVGCQSVAVETTEKLIDMLNKYLSNPGDFERKWYSKDTRNRLENI
jgi:hypothetical protein